MGHFEPGILFMTTIMVIMEMMEKELRTGCGVVRAFSSDRGDKISLQKSFSLLSCVWQLLEIVGLSIDVVVVTTSFIHCLGLILVLVVLFTRCPPCADPSHCSPPCAPQPRSAPPCATLPRPTHHYCPPCDHEV